VTDGHNWLRIVTTTPSPESTLMGKRGLQKTKKSQANYRLQTLRVLKPILRKLRELSIMREGTYFSKTKQHMTHLKQESIITALYAVKNSLILATICTEKKSLSLLDHMVFQM